MSRSRSNRLDRKTAERLLDSATVGRPAGPDHLSRLLAAAAGPGHADGSVGEDRAVAAFRTARPALVPERRRASALVASLAKLLTIKVAAVAGAVAIGGVALAASTGTLPKVPVVPHLPNGGVASPAVRSSEPSVSGSSRPHPHESPAAGNADPTAGPSQKPGSHGDHPTGRPTDDPDHPTGPPSGHADKTPTPHPSH